MPLLPRALQAGVSINLTRVWLGFNLNARRILNDFGVIRWAVDGWTFGPHRPKCFCLPLYS